MKFVIIRPADEQGDVMPVLSRADMLQGAEAVAALARERIEAQVKRFFPEAGEKEIRKVTGIRR